MKNEPENPPEPPKGYRIIPREYLEAGNPLPGDAIQQLREGLKWGMHEWFESNYRGEVLQPGLWSTTIEHRHYATAEPLPCFDSAPEQALPAIGDAARIAELELALAVIGDLAVADWDSETVGKVDALVKDPIRYKDQLRSLFNAHKKVAELERQLAEARAEGDDYADAVFERWTQAVANLANEIVGKPGDFDSSPGETEDETRRYILGQVLDHIEEHISDLRAQLAASEKDKSALNEAVRAIEEIAPHHEGCSAEFHHSHHLYRPCTCWKRTALDRINELLTNP